MLLSFCGSQCCFCFACSLMISQLVVWDFWHPLQKALCVVFLNKKSAFRFYFTIFAFWISCTCCVKDGFIPVYKVLIYE